MLPRLLSVSLLSLSISAISLPALARPEIASGDQWLEGIDQTECLARTDAFIGQLDVPSVEASNSRTGFFDDGVFRIFCYSGGQEASMLLVFTSHNESAQVATQFMQFALSEIAQVDAAAVQ